MTVICAQRDDARGVTVLGCNSRSLVGSVVLAADRSKWHVLGDWACGLTGAGVTTDAVLARRAKFPGDTDDPYAVTTFIRKCLVKLDLGEDEDGARDYDISALLIHRDGRVFDMDANLSLEEMNPGTFWATGSGGRIALGAAHMLPDAPVEERVRRSVEAAIALDSGCPGTPMIETF